MSEPGSNHEPQLPSTANGLAPLPGEPGIPSVGERPRHPMSRKGLLAVALLVLSLVAVSALSIQRFVASGKNADDAESKRAGDRPAAATVDPRRLDLSAPAKASAPVVAVPRIPALVPTADELAEPIGVHRTGATPPLSGGVKSLAPEDAPAMLLTTRPGAATSARSSGTGPSSLPAEVDGSASADPLGATTRDLQGYQRQLQALLDTLTRQAARAGDSSGPSSARSGVSPGPFLGMPMSGPPTSSAPSGTATLFGGQLQGSATPRVSAALLGDRSLTLPKGTAFTCALTTRIVSATSGLVGCQVQRNVFSDDGRVLLIERGSHLDGEYRVASLRPGTVRIPVLWTRLRTPLGVTVDIESPGTGPLGESGIDGYVDNRWLERVGGALLLSLIDDSVKLILQRQADRSDADSSNTVILPSTTSNTSKLAEKVLDSTVNIPPLIYRNQGGIVGIYVARDVDFSTVYELRAVER